MKKDDILLRRAGNGSSKSTASTEADVNRVCSAVQPQ